MPLHDAICDLIIELCSTVLVNRIKCSAENVIGKILGGYSTPKQMLHRNCLEEIGEKVKALT